MNKKVLFVVGSLREKSFNKTVAEYISKKLEEKGIETSFLNYSKLPFINQDIEFPTLSEVDKVRNEVKNVDALWIVTPEYNGSVPGPFKEFLRLGFSSSCKRELWSTRICKRKINCCKWCGWKIRSFIGSS